jgi:Mce-associated membrane protein
MSASSGATHRPDPNAEWARAIAEVTAAAEADAGDVTPGGGEVSSSENTTAASSPPASSPEQTAGAAGRSRAAIVAILGVATIAIASFGIWATVAVHNLRTAAATANGALVDVPTTRSAERAVSTAVNTVFSYSYADAGRTRVAAQGLLTGPAIREYDQLFALVEQEAPKEKLVVTTRVTSIGVELLTPGRARLLVFANQQDTMTGTGKSSYGGTMFAVTAVNSGGRWKIDNIDTFTTSP